jgi:hypothetical protein
MKTRLGTSIRTGEAIGVPGKNRYRSYDAQTPLVAYVKRMKNDARQNQSSMIVLSSDIFFCIPEIFTASGLVNRENILVFMKGR